MKVSFVVPSLSSSRAFRRLEENLTVLFEENRDWLWIPVVGAGVVYALAVLLGHLPIPQVWSR